MQRSSGVSCKDERLMERMGRVENGNFSLLVKLTVEGLGTSRIPKDRDIDDPVFSTSKFEDLINALAVNLLAPVRCMHCGNPSWLNFTAALAVSPRCKGVHMENVRFFVPKDFNFLARREYMRHPTIPHTPDFTLSPPISTFRHIHNSI